MPSVRVQINGTLTNVNPQQNTFTCFDVEMSGGNWTSGAYASDGVTPLWNGVHFTAMRQGSAGAEESDGGLRLSSAAQFTFIGGEVQVGGSIVFNDGTTPRTYGTRWRNSREFGFSSARIRNKTTLAIFSQIELFDIAFDLFRMPSVAPSIKARGSEYLYQYVGAPFGGADARFVAFDLENPSGTYDFDNFGSGWVELYNCKAGAALRVVTQHPSSTFWVRHCVPLYQDLVITARDTAGDLVPDVRFTATENPSNPPTVTFTTQGNLKVWDFRNPATYETTTNASGVALSSPVLNVWYWQTTFRQSLRFPSSTATYQGRAYNFKTVNVSAVLGASAAIPVSAGMISLDTATTVNEATALAYTGITFTPSGATGGTVTLAANRTIQEIWNAYRAWISQFANRASNDTWGCVAGNMSMGAWNLVVNSGVTLTGTGNVTSLSTTGTVTNNGSITAIYTSSAGTSTILELRNVKPGASYVVANNSTKATILFGTNGEATAQDYPIYFPPGSTGLQVYVARKGFGDQLDFEVITLVAGAMWYQFIDIPDEGVTQPTLATVLAYTTLETTSKLYDYIGAYQTTEAGLKLGNIVVRAGPQLQFGSYSGLVKQDAASVFSITGGTITLKANGLAATSRYTTIIATPPAVWEADTTEVMDVDIEDANGDSSVTIQAAGVSTFEIWKVTDATAEDDYDTGTLLDTVGPGKFRFIGQNGYKLVIRDQATNYRVTVEAEKGVYTAELFFGAAVQLAQSATVELMYTLLQTMDVDIEKVVINQTIINNGVKKSSLLIPHTNNTNT
jgi:hypothetical protein